MLLGVSWATADAPLKDKVIWLLLYEHTVLSLLRNSFLYLGVLRGPWEVPRGGLAETFLKLILQNRSRAVWRGPRGIWWGPGAAWRDPWVALEGFGGVCAQRGGLRKGA